MLSIAESQRQFDLNLPLSEDELAMMGMLAVLPGLKVPVANDIPTIRDINDVEEKSVDAVAAFIDGGSYNLQYAHYLRCQAIAALVAFDEGWKSFEEMVLKTYVQARRFENSEYRGDDPNKAFSLRVKQQAAEDFVKFIREVITEAVATPKPSLATKK